MIAATLSLSSRQVEVAIRYIEEHREEVMNVAERLLEKLIATDDFRGAGRIYVP